MIRRCRRIGSGRGGCAGRRLGEQQLEGSAALPEHWCALLEASGCSPEAVALALACGSGPRRPLLRWLLRWRQVKAELTAADLLAAGMRQGPELGQRLRQLRAEALEQQAHIGAGGDHLARDQQRVLVVHGA